MAEGVFTAISNAVKDSPLADPKNWHKPKANFYAGAGYKEAHAARKTPGVTTVTAPDIKSDTAPDIKSDMKFPASAPDLG